MLLDSIAEVLKRFVSTRRVGPRHAGVERPVAALKSIGFDDFLAIDMPPREMLLDPILPERSLAMLYAPRGIGKTLLSLSMGLAVASGSPLLRWRAPRQRRVLYVDGEMPLVSLQERLRAISNGFGAVIPNDGFRVLAADSTENGLSIGFEEGQRALDPLLSGVDLVIFDNLSTLCTNGSESASDAWVPMQNWLLKLRRQGIAVLLVHHAVQTVGSAALPDVKMLSIRSSLCDDPRITHPSKVPDLKSTSRNFVIVLTVTLRLRSKLSSNFLGVTVAMAYAGPLMTRDPQRSSERQNCFGKDLRSGRSPLRCTSARAKLGEFAYGRRMKGCLRPGMAPTDRRRTVMIRFRWRRSHLTY